MSRDISSKIVGEIIHLQNNFIRLTKLPAYFLDLKGNNLQKKPPMLCEFCKLIRDKSEGRERCRESDINAGMKALKLGKPYYYICHAGIPSVTIPCNITYEDTWFIALGQILLSPPTSSSIKKVEQIANNLNIDRDSLVEAYESIRIITQAEFRSAVNLLWDVTRFLCNLEKKRRISLELKEEKIKRLLLESRLKEIQIKALESQIQPHFLFNILNTISMLSLLEKAEKTHKMVNMLGKLLHYVLSNNERFVPLSEELELVRTYLEIQCMRFGERLKYSIDVEESLLDVKIPFMTLQPLVENSVIHGIEPKKEGGYIEIRGFKRDRKIILEIIDNGMGIPSRKLSAINKGDENSIIGIGIQNIKDRLKYYLGANYKIIFESQKNKGTKVLLELYI